MFNASSDVSETTTTDVGGAFYRYAGIEVRHQLRSYLVASAGLIYATQNSQDGIINDTEFRQTLGLEYYPNRNWVLFARYAHVNFDGVGVPTTTRVTRFTSASVATLTVWVQWKYPAVWPPSEAAIQGERRVLFIVLDGGSKPGHRRAL